MKNNKPCHLDHDIPSDILKDTEKMYLLFFGGKREAASRLRRSLIRRIKKILQKAPHDIALWCELGDLYKWRKKKKMCFQRAIHIDDRDPEANAELAELYAEEGNPRYLEHAHLALRYCRGFDVEESVILAVLEAGRAARNEKLVQRALALGRSRFPESSLFNKNE